MPEQFVIMTRWVSDKGQEIVHCYGPFSSRSKANTRRKRMMKEAREYMTKAQVDRTEAWVTKLITVED